MRRDWIYRLLVAAAAGCSHVDGTRMGTNDGEAPESATRPDASLPCPGGSPPPGVDISVEACTSLGPLAVAYGTQQDQAHDTSSFPASADARLASLGPAWFRIHAGADDTPAVLPESRPGVWDFTQMDRLVGKAFESGGTPMMNIRYPPPFMWSCSNPFNGETGTVTDPTFATFAAFVARVVSYYNAGSMTDENGTVVINPSGTAHAIQYWELWNEPDISSETPCTPSGMNNPALSPADYNTMWSAVSAAILDKDPAAKLAGPAVSQPITGVSPEYVGNVFRVSHPPDVVTVHGYAGDDSTSDHDMLEGSVGSGVGLAWILASLSQAQGVMATARHSATPLWLDETNVSYDVGTSTGGREWTGFAAAWFGAEVIGLAALKAPSPIVYMPFEYVSPQDDQSLVDESTGAPLLSYWRDLVFSKHLTPGMHVARLTGTSSVQAIAARDPASGRVDVLLANTATASGSTTIGGPGTPITVTVGVGGLPSVSSVHLWMLDNSVVEGGPNGSLSAGPVGHVLAASDTATVSFAGYGAALLELTP